MYILKNIHWEPIYKDRSWPASQPASQCSSVTLTTTKIPAIIFGVSEGHHRMPSWLIFRWILCFLYCFYSIFQAIFFSLWKGDVLYLLFLKQYRWGAMYKYTLLPGLRWPAYLTHSSSMYSAVMQDSFPCHRCPRLWLWSHNGQATFRNTRTNWYINISAI